MLRVILRGSTATRALLDGIDNGISIELEAAYRKRPTHRRAAA